MPSISFIEPIHPPRLTKGAVLIMLTGLLLSPVRDAHAQRSSDAAPPGGEQRSVDPQRSTDPRDYHLIPLILEQGERPNIDGRLDDEIWRRAEKTTGMTQRMPRAGQPGSERTELRIAMDRETIYVGIEAFEPSLDSIAAPLFRRDAEVGTDMVFVIFDPLLDRRTAYGFGVSAAGVQRDLKISDDVRDDFLWDAVWESGTSRTDSSWTVEMRIPVSQLRFDATLGEQQWGINYGRDILRRGETSFWVPVVPEYEGFVSRFGTLGPVRDLKAGRPLEIIPYMSQGVLREPGETGDPFHKRNEGTFNLGADLRYTFPAGLTASVSVNPDFGQVEADPTQINLSDNQLFFPEKRPFFVEGGDIFKFGKTKTFSSVEQPLTFYSRRIGRAPQGGLGFASVDGEFLDHPSQTSILSAAKLSGKTSGGWSIGALHAITAREDARYLDESGATRSLVVEPFSQYGVARVKKDVAGGAGYVGGFTGMVHRSIDGSYFESFLSRSAVIAGVDGELRFGPSGGWVASATASLSDVQGTEDRILRLQRSSVRYRQRPDSRVLGLDPGATSLTGMGGEVSLQKSGGEHWKGSFTYSVASPDYETNDLGFQNQSNYHTISNTYIYEETDPKADRLQAFSAFLFLSRGWNFDGDLTRKVTGGGLGLSFSNQWSFEMENFLRGDFYNDRMTRGGPVGYVPMGYRLETRLRSNPSRMLRGRLAYQYYADRTGELENELSVALITQPSTSLQISVEADMSWDFDTDQYVTRMADERAVATFGSRYVFSDITQRTLSLPLRVNWTFTPMISLETFVRPLFVRGDFKGFKEFRAPRTFDFDVYGVDRGTVAVADGVVTIDPDGPVGGAGGGAGDPGAGGAGGAGSSPAFSFADPDFNYASLQGNVVFRLQYRPGSVLYLVWQHQKEDGIGEYGVPFTDRYRDLMRNQPTNIFLVKVSYWFNG